MSLLAEQAAYWDLRLDIINSVAKDVVGEARLGRIAVLSIGEQDAHDEDCSRSTLERPAGLKCGQVALLFGGSFGDGIINF